MRTLALLGAMSVLAGTALAQQAQSAQQLFEAGQYQQAIQAVAMQREQGGGGPAEAFLAGQAHLKLNQNDQAKQEFARLAADEGWELVGESATALADGNVDLALERANQAMTGTGEGDAPASFQAAYQLGLVQAQRNDWAAAAEAFERAAAANPAFAYAHYYAGMASSRIQRPDRVAAHFEQFLKLAPNAPERSAVMSLMRTLRGS